MLAALLKLKIRLARIFSFFDTHSIFIWAGLIGVAAAFTTEAFRGAVGLLQTALTGHSGSLVEMAKSLPWQTRMVLPAAGAIGREGSMVQLAAVCASACGRLLHFDTERLRLLVACGAAAGITSAYNTPLAGAFFITEIVLGSISMISFGPVVVSSVVANMTMRAFPGYLPAYAMPVFPEISDVEALLFILMGAICVLLAPQFLRLLEFSKHQFQRLPLALPARLALGGLLLGILSIWVPQVWGNGYSVVNSFLHQPWVWTAVLAILAAKIVATALTTGSGAVGGVFTPTLFVGAATGWLVGAGAQALFPHAASAPYAYAVIGMGAFLAAATSAPLMAILMIFEMTLSYAAVLPLMLACVVAYMVARSIADHSMYEITRRRNRDELELLRRRGMRMGDLLRPAETVLPMSASVADMTRMFLEHPVKYIYIVDDLQRYQGVVALHDLTPVLSDIEQVSGKSAADFLRREQLHALTPNMSLGDGLQHFLQHLGERLPLIQSHEDPLLLGAVHKSSVLDACFRMSRPIQ